MLESVTSKEICKAQAVTHLGESFDMQQRIR